MYGVKIGPSEGIVQERYDKRARSVWNADEFRMQKGNGSGSYTDALYFNPANGEYEFTGNVKASQFIGGSIQIGSNFSVDSTGHMKAVGAEFSGDITASVMSGGQVNGAFITGGTVTGATVRTAGVGNARVELRSGFADVVVMSGPSGNESIFEVVDNYLQATLNFPNGGEIRAPNGILDIIVPGGVYVNGVLIG